MLGLLSDFLVEFLRDSPIRYWLSCFVVGAALESLGRAENQPWSVYLFNVRYGLLYALITLLLTPALNNLGLLAVQKLGGGLIDLNFVHGDTVPGQLATFAVYLFVVDFFYYWFHRAQHRFGYLWDQHSLHHSPAAVNVTTAVYHHWTEGALQFFFTVLPFMLLFKLTLNGMGVISSILGFWQFFIHANWRLPMGRLTPVVAGPQWHRIHHSRVPAHTDKNFAGHFPVWDVLFGTCWMPKPNEFPPTGLPSDEKADSVMAAAIWPFSRWAEKFRRAYPNASRLRWRARDSTRAASRSQGRQ